jgi:hypothetical protein
MVCAPASDKSEVAAHNPGRHGEAPLTRKRSTCICCRVALAAAATGRPHCYCSGRQMAEVTTYRILERFWKQANLSTPSELS